MRYLTSNIFEAFMSKGFFEDVAADKSQLGFDYQDLVCLEYLIDMRPGETVGLEVFDDVHHERICGASSLVQVKHSVNDGGALTNRDIDLWKTLYNWSRALDQLDSRDVSFVFYTNKKKTGKFGIVHLMSDRECELSELTSEISDIKENIDAKERLKVSGETENPLKEYVDHVYNLTETKKESLFGKISLVFSDEDIFKRLARKIEFFSIGKGQSLDVVHQLLGVFREQKYKIVKSGNKISIDYDAFRKLFQFDRIIKISQDRKVDFSRYYRFKNVNTIDPKDGVFAKQLSDIGIPPGDITEHAIEYAATTMFIQELIVAGEFSKTEDESIDEEVFHGWKSLHDRLYDQDGIDSDKEHNRVARNCFRSIGGIAVSVANSTLSRAMVSGKGIELSDRCRIGWRKDWDVLYGDEE